MTPTTFHAPRRTGFGRNAARGVRWPAIPVLMALLLLAAPGAFAAQERMPPDGLGADGCDWNNCTVANLDEDPDGAGVDWATASDNNTSHSGHFSFGTPTQALTSGANLQEFRASVRKNATCGSGTPDARIELWESGVLIRAGTAVPVTAANSCTQGTDCQVLSFGWDAAEVASAADVEMKVFGIKSGGSLAVRCAVDLGAVEWNAEVGAVGPTLPTLSAPTSPFATIGTGAAELGATIDANGGGTITAYGTVWGGAPAPTANSSNAGTDDPAMPHTFSHARTITQTPGALIYFRGYAINSAGTAYSPDGSFYLEPNPATGVTFTNVTSSGMRISWNTPGTGPGDGSIVVMKLGSAVDSDPVDGTAHTANATFGSGAQLGTGNYVVFRAAGTQVDVSGLSPSTTYHVAVYQYAGAAAPSINYQQDAPATGNQATTAAAAVPALSSPTATAIDTGGATLGATIDGDSGDTITDYGTVWGTGASPTGNALSAGGTPPGPPHTFSHARTITQTPGTLIYHRGYATNGAGTGYSPDGSFYLEPNQATGVAFSNVTSSTLRISWNLPGAGPGDGSIVVMKLGSAVDSGPVDGTAHAANATFSSGAELGTGNYVVFRASGTQVDVDGLSPGSTYHVAVYQYAGTAAPSINYQQDTPATGSQTTGAGGPAPTLSSPTATAIGSTTATLGATIDTGSGITGYGTVWGTSPAPTGNAQAAGGAPPGVPHTFSHGRTGLPAGTLVYYRGYATNGGGTAYSPDGSFYTDPGSQASRVRFSSTAETELIISWWLGSGDGVLVLVREGSAVDADPADGVEYTANAAFGGGDQIGVDNYVVYVGSGTQVTVTGIFPDTPYFVSVYEYVGSGTGASGINYLQTAPAVGSSGHNGSHGIECWECHFGTGALHGDFAVPRYADQEAVCQTCHNETGPASAKRDVAIHTGPKYNGNVDCGSCHELHNNYDFTTTDTHSGGTTAVNVEWIRSNTSKYITGALEPALYQASTGFFAWDDANPPWNGLCQTCHTGTDFHRNDASLGAGSHAHNVSDDCKTCHSHLNGFRGEGGDCTGCHRTQREISANPGTFRRQITESTAGAGDGEFGTDFTSHHVNDGTGAQIVTRWDCVVCHAEGNAVTGEPDTNYHKKDGVQLKDVDTGSVYSDWAGLAPFDRSSFCMSCHDSDGATIITTRTDPDPDATTDPLNPFNDGLTNAHEPDGLDGTPAPHSRGAVVDVTAQFAESNASHHAVLAPAYVFASDCVAANDPHVCCTGAGTGPTCDLPFGSTVDNMIQGVRTDLGWNSVIDCEDCHYGTATTKLGAHGTLTARYMLRDQDGNEAATFEPGSTSVCFRCHNPNDTDSVYPEHVGTTQHTQDSFNIFSIYCLSCHGGGEFGGIHGVETPVTDDDGAGSYNPNVFTYGSGLDLISNWTNWDARGVSCSTMASNTALNSCTQHSAKEWDRNPAREPTTIRRTYRDP